MLRFNFNFISIRCHSVLQVCDDLLAGRLTCPTNTLAILTAYWAQSEHGEYRGDAIDRQLLEGFKFVQACSKTDIEEELEFEEEVQRFAQILHA